MSMTDKDVKVTMYSTSTAESIKNDTFTINNDTFTINNVTVNSNGYITGSTSWTDTTPYSWSEPVTLTLTPINDYKDFCKVTPAKIVVPVDVDFSVNLLTNPAEVESIEEIVPGSVTRINFDDGTSQKIVLRENDIFDIEMALYYAYAKRYYKLLKEECVYDGLDNLVGFMSMKKIWRKKIDKGLELWAEMERTERRRKKRIEQKERQKARKAQAERDRKATEHEEQVKIHEEAILRALKQIKANEIAEQMRKENES